MERTKKILVVVLVLAGSHILCAVVGFVAHEAAVAKAFREQFQQQLAQARQDTLRAVSSELDTAKKEWGELAGQMSEHQAAAQKKFEEQLTQARKEALEAVATETEDSTTRDMPSRRSSANAVAPSRTCLAPATARRPRRTRMPARVCRP